MSAMVHHVPIYSANGSAATAAGVAATTVPGNFVVTSNANGNSIIQLTAPPGIGQHHQQSMTQQLQLPGGAVGSFQTALTAAPMVSYCTLPQATIAQHQQQQQHHHQLQQHHIIQQQQQLQQQNHQIHLASAVSKHDSGLEFLGNLGGVPYQLIAGSNGQTYMIRGDQLHLISQQPQLLAQLIDAQAPTPPPPPLQPQPPPLQANPGTHHIIMAAQSPLPLPQQQQQQQQQVLQQLLPQPPPLTKMESCLDPVPMVRPVCSTTTAVSTSLTANSTMQPMPLPVISEPASPASSSLPTAAAAAVSNSNSKQSKAESKKKQVPTISTGRRCLKSEKVNNEESVRRAKRRERNRVAAAKCRKKRQDQIECLTDEANGLETDNSELEAEITELLNKKSQLMSLLQAHKLECPDSVTLTIPTLAPISMELVRKQQQQQHQQTPTPPSLRSHSPGDLDDVDNDNTDDLEDDNDAQNVEASLTTAGKLYQPMSSRNFDPDLSSAEQQSYRVAISVPSTSAISSQQQQQQQQQQTTVLPPLHSIVSSLPSLSFASSMLAQQNHLNSIGAINVAQAAELDDSQPQSAELQGQVLPPDLAPLFAVKQENFLRL